MKNRIVKICMVKMCLRRKTCQNMREENTFSTKENNFSATFHIQMIGRLIQ